MRSKSGHGRQTLLTVTILLKAQLVGKGPPDITVLRCAENKFQGLILLLKPTSSSNYFLFHSFEPLPVASISQEARCLIKNLDEVQAESGTRSCLPLGHLLPPLSSKDGLLKAGDIPETRQCPARGRRSVIIA